ncbi:DUF2637 domain-containing protein [Streptomyces subrutilus]|uniref:DUF2637 domain-containing protein n=1 Tax=Streptomyces subrutilus TaxID=36818 RepID=A0A1E5NXD6_9ACTN|nr:DUF2637 domain-containing protein [Streptomyces subrutilus]OEJ20896.1 hypothetical protein BGK67_35260 [Streptomyces subrutilus]
MNVIVRVKAVSDSLGAPPWAVALAAALSVVAALAVVTLLLRWVGKAAARAIAKAREDEDVEGRARVIAMIDDRWRTIVGICGMSVSMYGLWGFAEDTAGLPLVLRIFFIAIFDGAEIGLMLGLARSLAAQEQPRWTEGMIRSRRMAWGLVAISAAANWVHAPEGGGLWAKIALAGVPVVSVKLLEHGLDLRIAELTKAEEEDGVRPGPLRLCVLLWRQVWIALFAWLGLDATSTTSETSRRLLAQRAARAVIDLARAQKRADRRYRFTWRKSLADWKVEQQTADTAVALDRADAPVDVDQALAVVRRTMSHMQAGQLGRLNYEDVDGVVNTVVSLSALQQKVRQRLEQQRTEVQEELRAAERAAEQERDEAVEALASEREERKQLDAEREQERERFEELTRQLREQVEAAQADREAAKREAAEQIKVLREAGEQSATLAAEDRQAEREAAEQRSKRDAKRLDDAVEQIRAEAKQQLTEQAERGAVEQKRFEQELKRLRAEAERAKSEAVERAEREAAERGAAEQKRFEQELKRLRAEAERAKSEAVERAEREAAEKLAADRAEAEKALAAEQEQAKQLRAELEAKQANPEPAEQTEQSEDAPRAEKQGGAGVRALSAGGNKGSLKERFILRVHELCEQGDHRLLGDRVTPRTRTEVAYQLQAELGLGSQGTARTYMNDAMELWEAKARVPGQKVAPEALEGQRKAPEGAVKVVVGPRRDTFGRPVEDVEKVAPPVSRKLRRRSKAAR